MKTTSTKQSEAEPERNVTVTMAISDVAMIIQSLIHLEASHINRQRNGWGHRDCPPQVRELLRDLRKAITEQQPELYE